MQNFTFGIVTYHVHLNTGMLWSIIIYTRVQLCTLPFIGWQTVRQYNIIELWLIWQSPCKYELNTKIYFYSYLWVHDSFKINVTLLHIQECHTLILYKIGSTDISIASMVYWCILSFFNDWGTGSNPVVGLTMTELFYWELFEPVISLTFNNLILAGMLVNFFQKESVM